MPQTLLSAGTCICTPLALSSLENLLAAKEPQREQAASFGDGAGGDKGHKLIQQITMCFKCL